jgi:hypothetical protein
MLVERHSSKGAVKVLKKSNLCDRVMEGRGKDAKCDRAQGDMLPGLVSLQPKGGNLEMLQRTGVFWREGGGWAVCNCV